MKKHVLIFSFIICSIALSYSISYGQEAKDNATYYYNIFDNNTTGSLTFTGSAIQLTPTAAVNNLAVTSGRSLRSAGGSTAGSAYASFIPLNTSLTNDDWEWSFLYKNTGASVTTDGRTIGTGTNTWKYWLFCDGTTGSSAKGFYITDIGGVLTIRNKYANDAANPGNFNTVLSYTLPTTPANATYAIKVQRLANGLFKLYVDQYSSTVTEAKTLRGSNSPGGSSTYGYSMLECASTTSGRFLFDELKMYTRQFQIVAYDAGLTPSPVGPGQPNTIVYSVALKMRGNYEFQQLTLNESPAVSTFLTSENLYKSADATFTPAVPAPDTLKQTGAGSGYYSNINDVYQSSGNSADGSLTTVGYYYVAGTTKSPLANGTLTFSGITSITTKDFNGAQAYTAYNSGGASTTPITFTATTIAYTTPQTYTVGTAIAALTPTTTGSPTSYATTGLPPGLSLNTSNGQITGTPTSYSPATNYTITASNASGSGSTTINITVNGPPVISYATPKIYNVGTTIPTLDDVNSGGVVPTTRSYVVKTLAGSTAGTAGSTDATGTAARLNSPRGIAFDGSGNLFVADYTNNTIRKITAAGVVTTFAGTAGTSGTTNATGTSARFNGPYDIASDPSGNLYVCDITNNLIRKITTAGVVTTIATVNIPTSITYDTFSGNLFVTTGANNTVAKVTLAGAVTTFAGSATAGSTNGTGTAATFNITNGITSDVYGNLYVVDQGNNQIRKITAAGVVTTLAGSTAAGNTDATGTSALFDLPRGIASDALGNLYVTDNGNNTIRLITPAGVVTTIMGGTSGFVDGTGTAAQFNAPRNLGIDPGTGYIYIPDYGNNAIRKVVPIGYSISATLPAGLTFNNTNGQITGTPTATSAATNYIVTASNIYGSSSTTINITVNPAAPVITYTTPQTYIAGTAITALTPTNTGGTITSASSSPTLPAGLSISATGVITGTPTTVSSATVYTITATNAGGSDTYDLTITINPAAPIVAYSTPQTYSAGTAITALTPTNTGGVITSASVSPSLPAGLSISATGVITGTPTSPSTATVYNITATNVTGSSTFALTITVNLPATASNYAFTQTITLNTSALGINSTLTNFPYLVYIKEDALKSGVNCANNVQFPTGGTNGYDFGFTTSAGTTELNYEVESFDPTTGTLLAWVRVPSVTNTNSTLKFYFGSATPAHPASFAKSTWGSDYLDVFHMSETPSTGSTASDATTYGRNGTTAGMTAADLVTGKIGKAYSFNGSSKKITGPNTLVTGPFTISAWINLVASAADQKIMTNQDATGLTSGGFKLGIYNTNNAETEGGNIGNRSSTSPAPPTLATGVWVYIQGVYTGTTMSNYVNGYLNKTISTTANPFGNNPLYVGVGEGGNIYYFNGLIDEARFSTVAKSSDWITAEYNNQNTPANFTNSTAAITANLTYSAPLSASLVYTWTGAVGTDMTTPGNWTAPVSGNPSMAPPTDGTASIVIPNTTSKPILSANSNYFGVTLASGATINLNGFTMGVGCNVYNSSGGQILSSNTASGLTFNGVNTTQTYTGTATANTAQLGVLTLNNTGTGTLTLSGGPVDIYNKLVITNGNLTIAGSTTLTLKSTATLTASVPTYGVSGSVTGVVTAERYLSGFNRGYRLISAPLATATLLGTPAGTNSFDMTQVIKYAYISGPGTVTGSPVLGTTVNSNGFDYSPNNNPSILCTKRPTLILPVLI
ncbi:hypothetical protein A0256_24430 [Mucilaginibacter sp. PAMC 26640]|nr:hypothetical protein A0256_24430 [Mucilaginibacter sp. PAMC 26640]